LDGLRGQNSPLNRVSARIRFPPLHQLRKKRASRPWLLDAGQADFLAPVRLREDVLSMRVIIASESRARSKEGIDEWSERRAFGED